MRCEILHTRAEVCAVSYPIFKFEKKTCELYIHDLSVEDEFVQSVLNFVRKCNVMLQFLIGPKKKLKEIQIHQKTCIQNVTLHKPVKTRHRGVRKGPTAFDILKDEESVPAKLKV